MDEQYNPGFKGRKKQYHVNREMLMLNDQL